VVINRVLNSAGAGKETRQIAFDVSDGELIYEAGDALGVWPTNDPSLVHEMLTALKLSPSQAVTLKERGDMSLFDALTQHFDIARITPEVLQFICKRTGNSKLADLLDEGRRDQLKEWLWGRQISDVLHEFPISVTADEWLGVLHWHGDTFDLPTDSWHLAASDFYPNQAFGIGHFALGLQFHLEVTPTGLERWYVGHACELAGEGIDIPRLREEGRKHASVLEEVARQFWRAWLSGLDLRHSSQ
jgi:hypothetical protein